MKSVVSAIAVILFFFNSSITNAQEIIKDTVIVPVKKSANEPKTKKLMVSATVDYRFRSRYWRRGVQSWNSIKGITRCQNDSVNRGQTIPTDSRFEERNDGGARNMVSQIGSKKVVQQKDLKKTLKLLFWHIIEGAKPPRNAEKIVEDVLRSIPEDRKFQKGQRCRIAAFALKWSSHKLWSQLKVSIYENSIDQMVLQNSGGRSLVFLPKQFCISVHPSPHPEWGAIIKWIKRQIL
jgi:hypothetical protein